MASERDDLPQPNIILTPSTYPDGFDVIHAHGDSEKVLTVPDGTATLVVSCPPYNIGKPYEKRQELDQYIEWQSSVLRSKSNLPWVNFNLVDMGRARRNDIAHRHVTVPRAECWEYIDVVEKELISWKIIPTQ